MPLHGPAAALASHHQASLPKSDAATSAHTKPHTATQRQSTGEVAREHGVKRSEIIRANPRLNHQPDLAPGDKIDIPQREDARAKRHQVEGDETPKKVADKYGVPERALREENGLEPHEHVRAGDTLNVPEAEGEQGARGSITDALDRMGLKRDVNPPASTDPSLAAIEAKQQEVAQAEASYNEVVQSSQNMHPTLREITVARQWDNLQAKRAELTQLIETDLNNVAKSGPRYPGEAHSAEEKVAGRMAQIISLNPGDQRFAESVKSAGAAATDNDPAIASANDASSIDAAYHDAISSGKSEAQAAAAATERINEISLEHADDPQYVNQVLQQANATMDKVAVVLGENSKNKSHNSEADRQAIDSIISDLSDVSGRGNDFTALSIATTITKQLANSGELHHVDDAFYSYLDGGGDNKLFNTLIGTMQAADHGKGADGLKDRGGNWIVDGIVDAAESVAGALANVVGGALGVIKDFTIDAATGVANVVTDAGEFAVDFAKGTIDVAGDIANITEEAVDAACNAAVEAGLELGAKAIGFVADALNEAIEDAIDENKIKTLGPGDSYEVYVDASAAYVVAGSVNASMTVSCNEDGTYTVSAELGGGLGVGLGKVAGAEATLSGRVEFTFATAAEATEGARDVASVALTGGLTAAIPVLAGLGGELMPSTGDLLSLKDHVSAIEVSGGASLWGGAFVGLDVDLGAIDFNSLGGGSASLDVVSTYRIEFKDGKAVSLVRRQTLTLEGEGANNPAVLLALKGLGVDIPDISASGAITIELESRMPVDGLSIDSLDDVAKFALNPTGLISSGGDVQHTVTIGAEATLADNRKVNVEWKITNLDTSEISDAVIGVLTGNFENIKDIVDVEQTTGVFKIDDIGIEIGFFLGVLEIGRVVEDRTRKDTVQVA
jgi:LysM repeat protein